MSDLDRYKVDVPEGRRGKWAVERFEVTIREAQFYNLRLVMKGDGGRRISPGVYTRLVHGDEVVMSDTRAEVRDHLDFIGRATGNVLIHGLGLGMCVKAVLAKPDVRHVTVVERDPDVITLVASHYACDRFTVIEGDAFTWELPRGVRWDVAWHDIWHDINADNLSEMHQLHRRFGRRTDWQGSWCRDECARLASGERARAQRKRWVRRIKSYGVAGMPDEGGLSWVTLECGHPTAVNGDPKLVGLVECAICKVSNALEAVG